MASLVADLPLPLPDQVDGLATAGGNVWAVSSSAAAVLRIDPRTAEIRDRIPMIGELGAGAQTLSISAGTNFIWVLNGNTSTVVKIDPTLHDVVETYRLQRARFANRQNGRADFRLVLHDRTASVRTITLRRLR